MAYENSWQFDLNRYYSASSHRDQAKYFMWLLAARLTGKVGNLTQGLWTVYASSDGVTYGVDTVDRLGIKTAYQADSSKFVRAEGSRPHSWIVLKSPFVNGSYWYMCMSYNTIDDGSIKVYFSKIEPFSGNLLTTPRAPVMWGGAVFTGDLQEYRISIEGAFEDERSHFCLSNEGAFICYNIKAGTDKARILVSFLPLKETLDIEQYPVYTYIGALDFGTYDLFADFNTGNNIHPSYTGEINSAYQHQLMDTTDFYPSQNNVSLIKFPVIMYSRQMAFPQILGRQATTGRIHPNYRGLLKDVYYIGECPLNNGTSLGDQGGQTEFVKMGSYLIPANAAITT